MWLRLHKKKCELCSAAPYYVQNVHVHVHTNNLNENVRANQEEEQIIANMRDFVNMIP